MLSPFDQIEFYPVSEEQIDKYTEEASAGKFKVDIVESVFDHKKYLDWVQENSKSIDEFQKQSGQKREEVSNLIKQSNAELEKSSITQKSDEDIYGENAEKVYSEYSGRVWKPLVEVGDEVKDGQGIIVVEAMKTEMVVGSTKAGKVVKIVHTNGDVIDAGDLVAIIE